MQARPIAAALIPLVLAACAGAGGYTVFQQTGGVRGAPTGPIPLVVFGTPPNGASAGEVAAAAAYRGKRGASGMTLVPAPADPASTGRRMVLSFSEVSPQALCAAAGPVGAPAAGGGTEATAAYCQGAEMLGGARMRTAAAGPGAEGFSSALAALYRGAVNGLGLYDDPGNGGGDGR